MMSNSDKGSAAPQHRPWDKTAWRFGYRRFIAVALVPGSSTERKPG